MTRRWSFVVATKEEEEEEEEGKIFPFCKRF